MYRLITTIIALAPCVVLADGWSDCWPSQEHPREGYRQLSEIYTAVVERCTVVNQTPPSAPAWYRSNRATFINLKNSIKSLIPKYVDKDMLDTNSPYCSTRASLLGSTFTIPMLNVTGVLYKMYMPLSYFDYVTVITPWRSLGGLGGSNVEGIVYPVGFVTNMDNGGGTHYPPGQTNWFTTDFGYAKLPGLLSNLVWTTTATEGETVEANVFNGSGDVTFWTVSFTVWNMSDWSNSLAWMQANPHAASRTNSSGHEYTYRSTMAGYIYDKPFQWRPPALWPQACAQTWRVKASGVSTNMWHATEFYAETIQSPNLYWSYPALFDNMGQGWIENRFNYISGSATNNSATNYSVTVGSLDFPPSWPNPPDFVNNSGVGRGYRWDRCKSLIMWDVDGGFVFK